MRIEMVPTLNSSSAICAEKAGVWHSKYVAFLELLQSLSKNKTNKKKTCKCFKSNPQVLVYFSHFSLLNWSNGWLTCWRENWEFSCVYRTTTLWPESRFWPLITSLEPLCGRIDVNTNNIVIISINRNYSFYDKVWVKFYTDTAVNVQSENPTFESCNGDRWRWWQDFSYRKTF